MPLDWFLYIRYAVFIALTMMIPVPFVDGWVENWLRRRLVRVIAARHGFELEATATQQLAHRKGGFTALGCLVSLFKWGLRKLVKMIVFAWMIKSMVELGIEVVHRSLMLEEAFGRYMLPGDAPAVRDAMDDALLHIDIRPIERKLRGALRDPRGALNAAVFEATKLSRRRLADGVEESELSPGLRASLTVPGLAPELLHWFRMSATGPRLEQKVGGLLEAESILPADDQADPPEVSPDIEDAVEILGPERQVSHVKSAGATGGVEDDPKDKPDPGDEPDSELGQP